MWMRVDVWGGKMPYADCEEQDTYALGMHHQYHHRENEEVYLPCQVHNDDERGKERSRWNL